MKKILLDKVSLIILLLFFLFSCESDYNLNTKQTILQCHVYEGQVPKIILGQTLEAFPQYAFNIEYYEQPFYINEYNSNIEISVTTENEVYTSFEMKFQEIPNYFNSTDIYSTKIIYFSDENFVPEEGKEYEIEIKEIPEYDQKYTYGFIKLKSKAYIPERIPINHEISEINDSNYGEYLVEVSFDDPSDERNFYFLTVSLIHSDVSISIDTINMEQLWLETGLWLDKPYYPSVWHSNITNRVVENTGGFDPTDPDYFDLPSALNGILLNDDDFNGQTKELLFEIYEYDISIDYPTYIVLELLHLSEDYYNYYDAIEKQRNSQSDIFSEPAQSFTNIENGVGIFAGATISTEYIELPVLILQ